SPLQNTFTIPGGALDPALPTSAASLAAGANTSFLNAFSSGGTLASITAANPFFVVPSIVTPARKVHNPQYQEWNLQFQQGFGSQTSVSINYVGNHGIYEAVQNGGVNAFCDAVCAASGGLTSPFGSLPIVAPDPRFGTVFEVQSGAISNYNGL